MHTPGGMSRRVDRDEVRRLADAGAHVVDVLPRRIYRDLHIAGALNIPLGELDRKAAEDSVLVTTPDGVLLGALKHEVRP